MLHVMIDIETLGVRPWSVIRSIGAASFNPFSSGPLEFKHEFYSNVTRSSCEEAGLVVEKRVEEWWTKQSQAARDAVEVDQKPLPDALDQLSRWWHQTGAKTIWCQGAAFDFPILTTAYEFLGKKPPWNFRECRDTRTAYHVLGFDADSVGRQGTYHSALDDSKHQARCLVAAIRRE